MGLLLRRGDSTNSSNVETRASKSTKSRLRTRTRSFGSISTSCAKLDVKGGDAEFLAASSHILGSQHGGIGARFITISLDFHSTSNTRKSFLAGKIGHVLFSTKN